MFKKVRKISVALGITTYFVTGCSVLDQSEKNQNNDGSYLDGSQRNSATINCDSAGLRLAGDELVRTKEPKPTVNTGVLQFKLTQTTVNPCTVTGYVVGSQDTHKIERIDNETFVVAGLGEGEHDVILTAETFSGEEVNAQASEPSNIAGSRLQGARVNEVGVVAGQTITEPVTFGKLGGLRGNVRLAGQNNHEGIEVFIPGTQYSAKTDATGGFQITNLPPGTHDLVFQHEGYHESRVTGVAVHSGTDRNIDNVVMVIGAGDATITLLGANDQPILKPSDGSDITLASRIVRFTLTPSGSPKLMRISENGNFANVQYVPFQATNTYLFKQTDELRTTGESMVRLSVEILENSTSQILEIPIKINYFPDVLQGSALGTVTNVNANGRHSTSAIVNFASIPSLATSVKIALIHEDKVGSLEYSLYKDFVDFALSSKPWTPVASSFTIDLKDSQGNFVPGNYIVLAKFRTNDFVESAIHTKLVAMELFPSHEMTFSVKYPTLNSTYKSKFELVNIALVAEDSIMVIDYKNPGGDNTFARMTESNAPAIAASHLLSLEDSRFSCGKKVVYLKMKHVPTGVESQVVEREIEYRCGEVIQHADLYGSYVGVAQARNKALFFGGQTEFLPVSGSPANYSSNKACRIYDFSLPADAANNWRNCAVGAPQPTSYGHSEQIGDLYFTFGGRKNNISAGEQMSGGVFDFKTEQWTLIPPPNNMPADLDDHYEVFFTATSVILISQNNGYELVPVWGSVFNVASGTWIEMSTTGAPYSWPVDFEVEGLSQGDTVSDTQKRELWTGNKLVVFGGYITTDLLTNSTPSPYVTSIANGLMPNTSVYVYYPHSNTWATFTDPAITSNYNQSDLMLINENEFFALGGSEATNNDQIKIKIYDGTMEVDTYPAFTEANIVSFDYWGFPLGFQIRDNLSIRERNMFSFTFQNKMYWFGGTYYDGEDSGEYTYNSFQSLDLSNSAATWQKLAKNTAEPFIASKDTYYRAKHHNNLFSVYSIVNPKDTFYANKNLFSVFDLNESSSVWRAFPNEYQFKNSETDLMDTANLNRDAPGISLQNNRYIIYGGGEFNEAKILASSVEGREYYDDPIGNGVILHVGGSPLALHSFTTDLTDTQYLEKGKTYRLGFKIQNAQIPVSTMRVTIENITNATATQSEINFSQPIAANGQYTVATNASTGYLEFQVDNTSGILPNTPVEIQLSYEAGTYAFGSQMIKGKASTTFYIASPSITTTQSAPAEVSFKDATSTINFNVVNTSMIDITDLDLEFSADPCVSAVVSDLVPTTVLHGQTVPTSIEFTFDPSCVANDVSGTISYTSAYFNGSLNYHALDGYIKTYVFGDDAGEQVDFGTPIPDPGTVSVNFTLPDINALGDIRKVTMELEISHNLNWQSDLRFYLQSPVDVGELSLSNFSRFVNQKTYDSDGELSQYLAQALGGIWTLRGEDTYDDSGSGIGTIESFIITVEYLSATP